jgi:hypothetical protein
VRRGAGAGGWCGLRLRLRAWRHPHIHRPPPGAGASELGDFVLRLVGRGGGAIPSLGYAPIDSATSGASCIGGYVHWQDRYPILIARCLLDIPPIDTVYFRDSLVLVAYLY